jgi:hypothetical protein
MQQPRRDPGWRRPLAYLLLCGALLPVAAAALWAQAPRGWWGTEGALQSRPVPDRMTGFTFCRLVYTSVRREANGQGWRTDFPLADQNLMIRLSELTTTPITRDDAGDPAHALVRASDPGLFRCPFLFASDVGTASFGPEEVRGLRDYLLKGGFLWADDFWGNRAWSFWVEEMRRVLPEYEVVEVAPEHPLFSTFYTVERVPQIPSIQFWRFSGGRTSERGAESATPTIHAIFDERGRVLVLMSHNTDIADGWEREGEEYEFFHSFSPFGYAVGINVAVWAMTH